MKIVRVLDNKPCYQLEKELQNNFMRYSKVKFLTLPGSSSKNSVFYFNKIFTLEENISKIKDYGIDIYMDLDTVFNKRGTNYLKDVMKDFIPVGNIYHINWEYANILPVKDKLPKDYTYVIQNLFETHKRYSTMLIPIPLLEEFLEFLKEINYRKLVENYYNKYLEEFLFSVFIHTKRLYHRHHFDKELIYNLYLRKDNLARNEKDLGYFHLTTKEMLSYYKYYCNIDNRYKKYLPKVKEVIAKLKQTKKYKSN